MSAHLEFLEELAGAPPAWRKRTAGRIRVLLVQRRSAARGQLRAKLRQEGYAVAKAENGAEFRGYLGDSISVSRERLPDLLIVDTDFVGEAGVDVLADLRRTYQHLPVILLSESFNEETLRRAGALDAAYLFGTPSDTEAVVLAALTLVDPGESASSAMPLRWLRWHQGGPAARH
jgi:CheY-like chemotaxis protein